MRWISIKYTLLVFTLFLGLLSIAQSFTASVNLNTVTVGQQFKLTYTLTGNGSNFRHAGFPDFRVLAGPQQQQSHQNVNGKVTSSFSITYILSANREGTFNLPKMICTVNDGKDLATNSISIQVLNSSESKKQEANQREKDIFLKLYVSKRKLYQGEQLVATYKMYTRLDIANISPDKLPSFTGFFSQEFNEDKYFDFQVENLNGVRYHSAIIKQSILSPQRSGDLIVDPYTMDIMVQIAENRQPRTIQEQMFGTFKNVKMKLKSNAVNLKVKPLPSLGKTASFQGAVGSYKISSSIDKQQVETNKAINLKISITGKGNLKLIKNPNIDFPTDFEVYEPKESAKINTTVNGVSGSKSFEYLIIPRYAGDFVIPAVEFSFFDATTGKYKNLSTPEYVIKVGKGSNDEANGPAIVHSVRKKDVALLGKDIRYLKIGDAKIKEAGSVYFGSKIFWFIIIVSLLLFAGLLVIRKRLKEMQSDVVGMKRKKANKLASKHLAIAKKHLEKGSKNEFYEEIFRSLHSYMGNKLNISVSELNKETITAKLKENKIEEDLILSFTSILGECEMARYAPTAVMNEQELFQKACDVINKIEEELK